MQKENTLIKLGKYLWEQVILPNLIWTVIINIAAICTSLYGIYKTISQLISSNILPTSVVVIILASLIANVLFLFAWIIYAFYYMNCKKSSPSFPKITRDYKITSSEYELFFENRHKIIHSQSATLEVQCDSLNSIAQNMNWTGQKYIGSKLDTHCDKLELIDTTRTTSPYPVVIKFQHPLRHGDTEYYRFHTTVEDNDNCMLPILGKVIKCETAKLVLRLTVPHGLIQNPRFCITTDYTREIPLNTPEPLSVKYIGNYEVYEKEIENLELLRCYSICWDFV